MKSGKNSNNEFACHRSVVPKFLGNLFFYIHLLVLLMKSGRTADNKKSDLAIAFSSHFSDNQFARTTSSAEKKNAASIAAFSTESEPWMMFSPLLSA